MSFGSKGSTGQREGYRSGPLQHSPLSGARQREEPSFLGSLVVPRVLWDTWHQKASLLGDGAAAVKKSAFGPGLVFSANFERVAFLAPGIRGAQTGFFVNFPPLITRVVSVGTYPD